MLHRATPADLEVLLALVREFAEVGQHPFDEGRARRALAPLLESDRHGVAWLLGAAPLPLGYAVLTWGYSLESGGREGLVDELYVRDRGRGVGTAALAAVVEAARAEGLSRLFLETESHNTAARRFYGRLGFEADDSVWMSRWL